MVNLPLSKLKEIAKIRSIKDYKNKSKEYLAKILSKSKRKITVFWKNRRLLMKLLKNVLSLVY